MASSIDPRRRPPPGPAASAVTRGLVALALSACAAAPTPPPLRPQPPAPPELRPRCAEPGTRRLRLAESLHGTKMVGNALERDVRTRWLRHYDGLGRLRRIELDDDGDGRFEGAVHYRHDAAGRLLELAQVEWTERYQYDAAGRVVVVEYVHPDRTLRTVTTYDTRGRKAREQNERDDHRYTHDEAGREVRRQTFSSDDGELSEDLVSTYDGAGRIITRAGSGLMSHLLELWTYDGRGNLARTEIFQDGQLLRSTTVTYDAAGRRVLQELSAGRAVRERELWTYDDEGDVRTHRIEVPGQADKWTDTTYSYGKLTRCQPWQAAPAGSPPPTPPPTPSS